MLHVPYGRLSFSSNRVPIRTHISIFAGGERWPVESIGNRDRDDSRSSSDRCLKALSPAGSLDVQGQHAPGHRRRESQDRQGCFRPYFIAFGDPGSQFQAEFRHNPAAERNDQITIAGANEDNAATGDLDIKGNLTIKGKGPASTIIDGNSLDRVFQVFSGKVQISGVTIQHGMATEGGGLLNSGGKVTLSFRCGREQHGQGNRRHWLATRPSAAGLSAGTVAPEATGDRAWRRDLE